MAEINFYNIDCIEFMKTKPDNHYDLAIVDPPYGIDLANMNMGIGNTPKASKIKNRKWKAKDWDKEIPSKEYFLELKRVSQNQIIWGGNYFDLGNCGKFIIWDKKIPKGLSFSDCEYAWTSFFGANKMFRYSAYLDKLNKTHPTQKPKDLYRWILKNYAKDGNKILDTHGGSMSIALACDMENFDLDICEIDIEYFETGKKRYNEFKQQVTMF